MSKHHWSTIRYRRQTSNLRYVISRVSWYRQRVERGLEDYRLKPRQVEFESAIEDAEQGMPFTLERRAFGVRRLIGLPRRERITCIILAKKSFTGTELLTLDTLVSSEL